jgi:putative molybdopterin biosynthesis protein
MTDLQGTPVARELNCQVRSRREGLRLGAGELAIRCGVTRQALHAVETGQYLPNTLVALRLARALGCRVEDLFRLPDERVGAVLLGAPEPSPPAGTRVQLAEGPDGWLALPLSGEAALGQSADGVIVETANADGRTTATVELFADPALARRSAVLIGCDPSLGLAAIHAARQRPGVRVLWQAAPSLEALRALARGQAHAAGIHLWEASSGVSNLGAVQRELPGQKVHLYTLWAWEQGLMVAPGNPLALTGPADLLTPGLQLVNRPEGAGSRALLDAWLGGLGVTAARRRRLSGYGDEAGSHLEAARRVAAGEADAAPGPRSAAQALGLGFVPVQTERFDLVVPDAHLGHPALLALIAAAQSQAFRAELSALGGYHPAHAGELWQSTA